MQSQLGGLSQRTNLSGHFLTASLLLLMSGVGKLRNVLNPRVCIIKDILEHLDNADSPNSLKYSQEYILKFLGTGRHSKTTVVKQIQQFPELKLIW